MWEDPGYRYLWSEEAHQVLLQLGIENTADIVREVADRYRHELERDREEEVRNHRGLAKKMLRNAGYDALRRRTVLIRRRRHRIIQVPIANDHPEITDDNAAAADEWPLPLPSEDQVIEQLHSLLPERALDDQRADHAGMLKQMGEELAKWLLRPSDPVTCVLHEDGCPHPDTVLMISQAVVSSLLNDLIEQASWTGQDKTALRPHHRRSPEEWENRLHQRLQGFASAQARELDPVLFDDTAGGRQARSRVARCVLHRLWFEARAAKFQRFADLAAVAVGLVYARQLARVGTARSTQRRLHAWLAEHQPTRHDVLCAPGPCPATAPNSGHASTTNEGDLA